MKVYIIDTPVFHIDGGAYFGVVPKILWEKKYPADERNMCKASCRSLLVIDEDRKILFDTGIGDKPEELNEDLYFTNYSQNLISNLGKIGFTPADITDVVLTHLHFDHCGGCFYFDKYSKSYKLYFHNAQHFVTKKQWDNALNPNYREKSSYFPEKLQTLVIENKIKLVEEEIWLTKNIHLRIFNGHTPGLMLPVIKTEKYTLFFTGDLIPAKASVPLAWISAYDLFPLTAIEEKKKILNEAASDDWVLIYQHDFYNIASKVIKTERGVRAANDIIIEEILNL